LTKLHEEIVRGRLSELAKRFSVEDAARGEMVLVIDRARLGADAIEESSEANIAARVAALESEGLDSRAALKKAARELGLSRPEAYRRLVAARHQKENDG
jgi:16S rRNA (cytidine1402-2'-O)-methyltransferase